jgi:hypothetical protein
MSYSTILSKISLVRSILLHEVRLANIANMPKAETHTHARSVRNTKMVKVKVNVKVQFTQEQTTKAQRWSRGIDLFFL